MSDFEDAVTSFVADLSGAELIITRNGSDFAQSSVCALSPDEFLAQNYSQIPQDGAESKFPPILSPA
ncbi:MAG: hypothetical protein ACK5CA_13120 [Cyanobacteriota bacterium]